MLRCLGHNIPNKSSRQWDKAALQTTLLHLWGSTQTAKLLEHMHIQKTAIMSGEHTSDATHTAVQASAMDNSHMFLLSTQRADYVAAGLVAPSMR